MAKSSRYMAALFGVLAGGRRRQRGYIRQQALVSKLYPYFFEDQVSGGATFGGGRSFGLQFAEDSTVGSASFGGGLLTEVVINYTYTEQVNGGSAFGGGLLTTVVVSYDGWPAEQVNGTATFGGGSMPSLYYGNYAPEQVNGGATFGGGTLI